MFCERCGNQLTDTADFCPKCGNEFYNQGNVRNNKEVLFEVRPTFKFAYIVLPKLLKELIVFIPFIIMMIYFITMNRMTSSYGSSSSIGLSAFMPIILIFIGRILFVIGKAFFDKKQYQNYVYTFYGDRVVFRDSFLNVSEKELKYRNIREITKRQTFIQRYFNIGNIVLFSNAESGFVNGVFMAHIEDVDDVYRKVKEIINV